MRITRIAVYTHTLQYAGKAYSFSHGRVYTSFPTAVVTVETDAGLTGYGEVCPCGPAYMPAYAEGLVPALGRLAPHLIGQDPLQTTGITQRMDLVLCGQGFAKTPVDLACWDLLGKHSGLPVYVLLGGKLNESIPLHRVVPLGTVEDTIAAIEGLRAQGFAHYQVKLGNGVESDVALMKAIADRRGPGEVYVGDANTAWGRDEAIRVSRALADVDCYLEQPCRHYVDCLAIRNHTQHPIKLDECLENVGHFRQAIADNAMDAAAIKLSKFGGITRSRIIRDLCVDAGIALTVEEAWGSGIASAAVAHLAVSTQPEALLNSTDIHNYNSNQIAHGAPEVLNGQMRVSDRPGLGVEPDFELLGDPVAVFDADHL